MALMTSNKKKNKAYTKPNEKQISNYKKTFKKK